MAFYCFRFLIVISFLFPLVTVAQEGTSLLWEQSFDFNYKLDYRWSFNFGSGFRGGLSDDLSQESLDLQPKHFQVSHNSTYNVGFFGKLGVGIMHRWNTVEDLNNDNELRLTQQYSHARRFNALRLVHRLQTDQRIVDKSTTHRFRYRFSIDFPLSGLRVDPREFYLVASTESLLSSSKLIRPEWDQRITLRLGFQVFKGTRLQLDAEYRWENFTANTVRRLFINTGWVQKI
ncbi:MAG: DUF2490 domain-containing protein [Flavobacteriaceae bacterium]|nr:DUF2490 domain-containing protein [Flavobacteriaceae bacterium]